MSQIIYLVLTGAAITLTVSAFTGCSLCQQNSDLCIYINTTQAAVSSLVRLVEVNKLEINCEACTNLLQQETVISVDDFYVEMTKYKAILTSLHSSMEAYMNSSEWLELRVDKGVRLYDENYKYKLNQSLSQIGTLIRQLRQVDQQTQTVNPTTAAIQQQLKDVSNIYAETYIVCSTLSKLLEIWRCNCNTCVIVGRRR